MCLATQRGNPVISAIVAAAAIAATGSPISESDELLVLSQKRELQLEKVPVSVGDPSRGFEGTPAWKAAEAKCIKESKLMGIKFYRVFGAWRPHYWCVAG